MSDSTDSDPKSHSDGLSTERKRKRPSSEVTASFGSFSEFGESNIGSTVNGDQERSFSFGTSTLFREQLSSPSPAPKPTSCCHSLSPRPSSRVKASTNMDFDDTSSKLAASSDPPPSPNHKFLLISKPAIESESHLPGKKRTFVSKPQSDGPSTKLTLGGQICRPFDPVSTRSHGSVFSGSSSSSSSSSQDSTFLSWPTQSSQLGQLVEPMDTSSYREQVVQSGTEAVSDDDGVLASLSSKPAFRGTSHEELRWQNYQHGYRGNNFWSSSGSTSTSSGGFNQIPSLAFGETNSQQSSLFNQSNTINITVPSFPFGRQNFTGQPFLLCLNNGPGFGFGQTFPCIIAFPQSASAFSEQNTSPAVTSSPPGPIDFGGFGSHG